MLFDMVLYDFDNQNLLFSFLEEIIVDFDAEHNTAAGSGDEVGDEKRPDDFRFVQQSLQHEADGANAHHQKSGERYAVGFFGADGVNGLRQIPRHHEDTGEHSAYFIEKTLFHSC